MVMYDEVKINGIDMTEHRLSWAIERGWDGSISEATIVLAPTSKNALTLINGMSITIKRGFNTPTDENMFKGIITQIKPFVSKITIVCKNELYEAIKAKRTKSWDKDIDPEAGIGSEIFKDICDHSGLNYDSVSIQSTGTAETSKIRKFVQNEEDDYDRMSELAEIYNYIIGYDPITDYVLFKPAGYTTYGATLTVGVEIPAQIKWKDNMEQLCNKVKIKGATVYDVMIESFAGPGTEFTLAKTPEESEVREGGSAGVLLTRGQKDVGTLGTDFDYYIDVEIPKLVFATSKSNIYIRYGAQVPLIITVDNKTSIATYGGANKTPHIKTLTFTDLKDSNDAIRRGQAYIDKYSTPFIEASKIPVIDSIIQTHGALNPGTVIRIIDNYNDYDKTLFVSNVKYSFPHIHDAITVGDEIWRTENWQVAQMKKINQLFNELNKNEDILISIFQYDRNALLRRRYSKFETKDRSGDVGKITVLDDITYAKLDECGLDDSSGTVATLVIIQPGDHIYRDYIYDDDFKGSGTATWNTTNNKISFTSGQSILTLAISKGISYKRFTINLGDVTGSILIEISGDNQTTWQTVTEALNTNFNSCDGTGIYLRFTESNSSIAEIATAFDTFNKYSEPAIYCKLEE